LQKVIYKTILSDEKFIFESQEQQLRVRAGSSTYLYEYYFRS